MQITMDLPHAFSAGSYPAEKTAVLEVLRNLKTKLPTSASMKQTGDTQVTFDLGRAFSPDSSPRENAKLLYHLMECLTKSNEIYLSFRGLAPFGSVVPLYQHPVYYERTVVWDSIPALYARGYGDCKSLAAALTAEYRHVGLKARNWFRFLPADKTDSGQLQFHILTQAPDGTFEDPSKVKGMGKHENAPVRVQG